MCLCQHTLSEVFSTFGLDFPSQHFCDILFFCPGPTAGGVLHVIEPRTFSKASFLPHLFSLRSRWCIRRGSYSKRLLNATNNVYNPKDKGGRVNVCDHAFKHKKDEQVAGGLKVYAKIVSLEMIPHVAPCSPTLSPLAVQHLLHRDLGKALRPSSKSMTSSLRPEQPFDCFGCNPLALDCHRQTAVLLGLNNTSTSAQNKTAPSNGWPYELFLVSRLLCI